MYYCPQCRNEMLTEARFCNNCGYRLTNVHHSQSNHQFIRPAFIAPKEGKPGTPHISDQQILAGPKEPPRSGLLSLPASVQAQTPHIAPEMHPLSLPTGSILPQEHLPKGHFPIEVIKGKHQLPDTQESFDQCNEDESYVATSQAAEHWRTSWRNRQRTEAAGPATTASRGHSSVPEPLTVMQHSLLRMRAIIRPKNAKEWTGPGFWITITFILCIIGGLGMYIASTYLPVADQAATIKTAIETSQPALAIQGTPITTIAQGQMLHLHGENFNAGAPIIFELGDTVAINGTDGREISILASNQGTFDATLPVTSAWSAGSHKIEARDNKSGQSAYLLIQVALAGPATTSSHYVSISTHKLTFKTVLGQGNPKEQLVTLTNISHTTPLEWTVAAIADDNLGWLFINNSSMSGRANVGGSSTVGIGANTAGLESNKKPFTGHILFSINQAEQLTLPVELYVQEGTAEVVISPTPMVGVVSTTGACLPGAQLTLINISNSRINWNLTMDDTTRQHIEFMYQGKPLNQGQLAPGGEQGDTQIFTMVCTHVGVGNTFLFTVYANSIPSPVAVSIQATP